ncbi:type VI lipase adapter Tla3 domain-containing protein [Achromobacter spanius]|uniref:type VI lipase adapter Tla3 domain-containing protein n=1 Tax=Achromobacter spanius TaxID=217203 RepID=UPI0032083754
MPQSQAPLPSARLATLDIVRVGLSLDVYRQGQVWAHLQAQNKAQPQALHSGTVLPMDPERYPVLADLKDMAWEMRKAHALELALQGFPERWPIPTLTIARDYGPKGEELDSSPEEVSRMLNRMVNSHRAPAGMHWHRIRQLEPGVICNTTPEAAVEYLFRLFEVNPDMPALLVYSVEGYNIARALGPRRKRLIGGGTGPRQPGELTDAVVALIVARPERVDWLRAYAPYTKPNARNEIDPAFTGWKRQPPRAFTPTPSFAQPITEEGFKQWDRLRVLAQLHRPVEVSLMADDQTGKPLKGPARHAALARAWQRATLGIIDAPARVFYDTGHPIGGLVDLAPALAAAQSPLDPLDSTQSYDLTQRLGDTGASSPFVGIALATMGSYLNADTSVVMPLRQPGKATVITITSATPGQKPDIDPFDVKLRPQHSKYSEAPSPEFVEQFASLTRESQRSQPAPGRYIDPARVAYEQRLLDAFIASAPGADLPELDKP